MDKKKTKILFCGGATGGHLYPAIALAEQFSEVLGRNHLELLFIGSSYGLESRVLPEKGYNFKSIWIRGIQRGWRWQHLKVNLLAPFRIVTSLFQSIFYIKHFSPDFAIGTGGYSSGPPLYIADKMGIDLFLQEQNVYPGVTTRLLAKKAQKVYTAYQNTDGYIANTDNRGMPIRRSFKKIDKREALKYFDLKANKKTIFMFGGSQGSRALNQFLSENITKLTREFDCQFIWQTGRKNFSKYEEDFQDNENIYITPYIDHMDRAYSACDLVLSRAGALSLAELCEFGKPSILVPLPIAAANHQEKNARDLEEKGAAKVILEQHLTYSEFSEVLKPLFSNTKKLKKMGNEAHKLSNPRAAQEIVNDILKIEGIL
ncbi:MAG: undecaprenyldiphospho-muramoylpentapeptide beta-N-acetylglucosaminyltransferase [Candidatus Marinimicrobia bacterium]|nr:undecaprenyldiphospho-muramoylpentapeptide beta-N-acetylglucosaminyltransferase [Candidatus Neomarinimicrobiota bacterium]